MGNQRSIFDNQELLIEREQLMNIYRSNNGPLWRDKTHWMKLNIPLYKWHHVKVSETENGVVRLNLTDNGLTGVLPSFHLSHLQELLLSQNSLEGTTISNCLFYIVLIRISYIQEYCLGNQYAI